jgi:hypothetical protein
MAESAPFQIARNLIHTTPLAISICRLFKDQILRVRYCLPYGPYEGDSYVETGYGKLS